MRISQRTRNRLAEHQLVGTDRVSTTVSGFVGTPCRLFECQDPGCTWRGWLPIAEVDEATEHQGGAPR